MHRFRLAQRDYDGAVTLSPVVELCVSALRASLLATAREVRLSLPKSQHVRVAFYDGLGREVALLHAGEVQAEGVWLVPPGLASGVYFVRARGDRVQLTRSLVMELAQSLARDRLYKPVIARSPQPHLCPDPDTP